MSPSSADRSEREGRCKVTVALDQLPGVVGRYFELDPEEVELFVELFSDDATVLDEGETHRGTAKIRSWRTGPATKYTYTTEVFGVESHGRDRYLVSGRLTGDFPGGTADLRWDFTLAGELIGRLVIAP
jgi:hypothetical protein